MLQYQTIHPATRQLLKELQSMDLLKGCRLVGGTALALQLGHRRSVDLDFFGFIPESADEIQDVLGEHHEITIVKESKNIHIYLLDGVKVDIVHYKYGWLSGPVTEEGLCLAGISDIAAMKVAAIIGRGTRKDFIDLFFLLFQFSLEELFGLYLRKYPEGSLFVAMKSLADFEDAEADPMPDMLVEVDWSFVKESIRESLASLR